MQRKHFLVAAIPIAILVLVGIFLFPPWYTAVSGNGYPLVSYQWVLDKPQPVFGAAYEIDLVRLQWRVGFVISVFAVAFVGNELIRKLRRNKASDSAHKN